MSKTMKQAIVDHLVRTLEGKDSGVVINAGILSVAESEQLRQRLRKDGIRLQFLRNNLAAIAFDKVGLKGLETVVTGPSALAYGGEGAIAISKIVVDEAKKIKKLEILGGIIDGAVIDKGGVETLSKMPGKKELQAMVLQSFFSPISGFHAAMGNLLGEVHGLFEAFHKKQEGGAAS